MQRKKPIVSVVEPTLLPMSDGFQASGDTLNYFSSQQSTSGFMSLLASMSKDVDAAEF